jgi:hypothetical protein
MGAGIAEDPVSYWQTRRRLKWNRDYLATYERQPLASALGRTNARSGTTVMLQSFRQTTFQQNAGLS